MNARLALMLTRSRADAMAGFTLFESVIVMVLVGILSVTILPKAFNSGDLTIRAQARNLASDLQQAQTIAITTGVNATLSTSGANQYTVQYTLNSVIQTPISVTLGNNAVFNGGMATVTFDSLGQPSSSGSFILKSGGTSVTLTIEAVTGLVRVQ